MIITNEKKNNFKQFLLDNERSKATISKYMHDIECFRVFASNRDVDKQLVLEYKTELAKKYEVSSANSMIAAINAFFRFLGLNNCIVRQFHIQKKVFCDESKELSRNEYERLVKAAKVKKDDRLYLILQTICGTGIRVSELEFFTIEAIRKGTVVVTRKGKTRDVFIVHDLQAKLIKYAKSKGISTGQIFKTKNGKTIDRSNIWREMKKLCKKAGVSSKKVFPHNLRHLFARVFYKIEKDIAKLADVLGHSSIDTARIYIISTGAEHRRQMENMRLII